MFRQLHNIDSAFRHVRLFSLFFLLGCLMLSGWAIWKSYELVAMSREQIYVLMGAQANPARLSRRANNIPVEARDHIRMFHHWFFTIDPDEEVIRDHMSRALALADGSAKSAYDNLREKGYYSGIISANISQEVEIDSITLTGDADKLHFVCFSRQKLIRSSSTLRRKLTTEGELREVGRSDWNPHGFLIVNWRIRENTDLPK